MTVTLLRGNALALPLADATVDLVVTSPPYFGLRSYQDGGEHYAGQIGSEATPAEWVEAMLAATAEMVRVLKPSGSIWVNLGDKYATPKGGGYNPNAPSNANDPKGRARFGITSAGSNGGIPTKSLIGLPWRYALACIDQLGLILRAEVIWSKPNGLPESVTDRVRRSHEQWFHLTKQPRYFSAVDEIREAHAPKTLTHRGGGQAYGNDQNPDNHWGNPNGHPRTVDPLGKLPGSVWSIPSQPLTVPPELGVDHFAAFPMEWPRRLVAGWSPTGVCVGCGEGRRPVSDVVLRGGNPFAGRDYRRLANVANGGPERPMPGGSNEVTITGYACGCNPNTCRECAGATASCLSARVKCCPDCTHGHLAPTRPAVVLDPFGGTGTTAVVAHVMGRHGISVDMSADYTRLAAWRTTDPGELAKAAQVEKPAKQTTGQTSLFEHLEGA